MFCWKFNRKRCQKEILRHFILVKLQDQTILSDVTTSQPQLHCSGLCHDHLFLPSTHSPPPFSSRHSIITLTFNLQSMTPSTSKKVREKIFLGSTSLEDLGAATCKSLQVLRKSFRSPSEVLQKSFRSTSDFLQKSFSLKTLKFKAFVQLKQV